MTFSEVTRVHEQVDIEILFLPKNHSEIDRYILDDSRLSHGFYPGEGIGGDVHILDETEWDFDGDLSKVSKKGSKSIFFKFLIHEVGHALGLGHSHLRQSIMNPFIEDPDIENGKSMSTHEIEAIQSIYGVPEKSTPSSMTEQCLKHLGLTS